LTCWRQLPTLTAVRWNREALDRATTNEVANLAQAALESLANRSDRDAFAQLLRLAQINGECLGTSARTVAEHSSWSGVADMTGTTKQAAWARWRVH
jgi:hypothetical protein